MALQMEQMKQPMAAENLNIQWRAQQLVLAETQKVAAAENAAQVKNNEGQSELIAARLEAESLRAHADRLAEMAKDAVGRNGERRCLG